jgi:hypothetical protein
LLPATGILISAAQLTQDSLQGGEAAFRLLPETSGEVLLELAAMHPDQEDLDLIVLRGSCDPVIASCAGIGATIGGLEQLTVDAVAGEPLYLIVDGHDSAQDELTMPVEDAYAGAVTWSGRPLQPEVELRSPIGEIVHRFEAAMELPQGRLAGGTRTRMDGWNRCLFSTFAVEWLGFPAYQVARALNKARGSVSRWLSEGLVLQQSNGLPELLDRAST